MKENTFWMQPGTAFYLGQNPKERTGVALHKVPIVQVSKQVAVRTEHMDGRWLWIGSHLCVLFRDPETNNIYAQPVETE